MSFFGGCHYSLRAPQSDPSEQALRVVQAQGSCSALDMATWAVSLERDLHGACSVSDTEDPAWTLAMPFPQMTGSL